MNATTTTGKPWRYDTMPAGTVELIVDRGDAYDDAMADAAQRYPDWVITDRWFSDRGREGVALEPPRPVMA